MNHAEQVERWRQARLQRLTAADGWLALVGLPWLEPGRTRIGSGADNAIVVEGLPEHFGWLDLDDEGRVVFHQAEGTTGHVDGPTDAHGALLDDSHAQPTLVRSGDVSFFLVRRGEQTGLRIRNVHAATREQFLGLQYFPIDPAWRIEAQWLPAEPGEVLLMSTVIGTLEEHRVAGHAVFERDGQRCDMLPVLESPDDDTFFLVFADLTSGKETYGAARFVYTEPAQGGRIVIDFNKAYNPPCAFTAYATCPMAPPENRLPWRVEAGELKYAVHP